ncbi:hypothetical protein ACFLQ2_04730 [archaeon]
MVFGLKSYSLLVPAFESGLKEEIAKSRGTVDVIVHPRFCTTLFGQDAKGTPYEGMSTLDILVEGKYASKKEYMRYVANLKKVLKNKAPKFVLVEKSRMKQTKKWVSSLNPKAKIIFVPTVEGYGDPKQGGSQKLAQKLDKLGVRKVRLHGEIAHLRNYDDLSESEVRMYIGKMSKFKVHFIFSKKPLPLHGCAGELYGELHEFGRNYKVEPGHLFPGRAMPHGWSPSKTVVFKREKKK